VCSCLRVYNRSTLRNWTISQVRSEKKHDNNDNNVNSLSCLVLRSLDEDNSKVYERIGAVNFLEGEGWTKFFGLMPTNVITIV